MTPLNGAEGQREDKNKVRSIIRFAAWHDRRAPRGNKQEIVYGSRFGEALTDVSVS
jgi:hypothetical protein